MGLFSIFSGKTYEELEQKADDLFNDNAFGEAKIQYEKSLNKLEKKLPGETVHKARLEKKINESREALAVQHKQNGENLVESGCYEDAGELFHLALELTQKKELTAEIKKRLQEIQDHESRSEMSESIDQDLYQEASEDEEEYEQMEEYFAALCGALPEEELEAYMSYSDAFRIGFIALNQGDFELAVTHLNQALDDDSSVNSFIPLELATAYMNLGESENAYSLLESYIKNNPENIKAYQLLCEIFWENDAFDQAQLLLQSCPQALNDSLAILLLSGETLYLSKRYESAVSLYLDYIKVKGWNEMVALSLAKTYEALGSMEKACSVYGELMNACQGCGRHIDPFIKRKYADSCFETGQRSTMILELYLSLGQEDSENRAHYYKRISQLYESLGNKNEAQRYASFFKQFNTN